MRNYIIFIFYIGCFLMFSQHSFSQRLSFKDSVPTTIKTNYLAPRLGLGTMILRDQNLSPLFYQGIAASFGITYEWYKPHWYHDINLQGNYGALTANSPISHLPKSTTLTHLVALHLSTTHLWKTPWINKNWLLEIGGAYKIDPHARLNPSLYNNSVSGALFMNVMASGKIIWDFTRNKSYYKFKKNGKKKLKTARQQKLSFQLDVGVLNFNYMPGYTNAYMPSYDGTLSTTAKGYLDQYNFRLSGWRIDFTLQFLQLYSTGNGHKIALIWSAMHAPGVFQPIDYGTVQLQYSIMINQKR